MLDFDSCYHAISAKDARFDGWFFTAVTSTGVYCRPSCPARTPFRENVRFLANAAAAQAEGFRACKRCRPDATPGSPEWDSRADLVGRSIRLIADGVVDREGVSGLAKRLGFTERHLGRLLTQAVGAGPLALARAQRAQTARVLLETTDLAIVDVALTSGFSSVRQFNTTIRELFASTPTQLRARCRRPVTQQHSGITLRLPLRTPFAGEALLSFFAARAVPGVEEVADGAYRRSLRLPHGPGVVELVPRGDHVRGTFWLEHLGDLGAAINRSRRLLDLDSDPLTIIELFGSDPVIGPLVGRTPGLRVPGSVDGSELALRAVLGQQVSLAGARTLAGRLVATCGEPLPGPVGAVTRQFPSPAAIAAADLDRIGMPGARRRALLELAQALDSGAVVLDDSLDRAECVSRLRAVPGIGPWTVSYITMRALRDPDAFLATDLGIRRALQDLGLDGNAASAERLSERWRPYRAYAAQHLWTWIAARPPDRGRVTEELLAA